MSETKTKVEFVIHRYNPDEDRQYVQHYEL
jgi:succinate dehydrogenase/fumarate reductase-like Fe-S protein